MIAAGVMSPVAALTRITLCALGALALLGGEAPRGDTARKLSGVGPTFWVVPSGGHFAQDQPELDVEFDFGVGAVPGRISVFVPAGFELYPARPVGSDVGLASVYAADYSRGGVTRTLLEGSVTAAALDDAAEESAQECSPGRHLGRWLIGLSLLGQSVDVPVYLAEPRADDPARAGVRLDVCPPAIANSGALLPISQLTLLLPELEPPSARGSYVWRAVVAPLAPDQRTILATSAYELRAAVLVPHKLTLAGRYLNHAALLHGTLRASGQPRPGVPVTLIKLVRTVTPDGARFHDVAVAAMRTKANGAYAFRVPLRKSAGFIAIASATERACTGAALAPRGCLNMTTAGTESDPITISTGRR
jgi:hypothetical protein